MIVNVTAIVVTLHRRSSTAVRHRCAQHCDSGKRAQRCSSENEHSRCDSRVSDSAEITMCTLV